MLRIAVNQATLRGDGGTALRDIAEALVDKARSGDVQAIKEVADRLDGKVPQGLIGGDEGDPELKLIVNIGGDAPNNG